MTNEIVTLIADALKAQVPGLSCLNFIARKFEDRPVVLNGKFAGVHDSERVNGYIRYREDDSDHQYQRLSGDGDQRKFTSCHTDQEYMVAIPLRLVLAHKFKDELGFESLIASILTTANFTTLGNAAGVTTVLENSTTNKEFVYFGETFEKEAGDDRIPPEHVNLIQFDFSIGYRTNVCEGVIFNENECL